MSGVEKKAVTIRYRNNTSRVPQKILRLLSLELGITSRVYPLPTHRRPDLCNFIFALHKCWACILAINPMLRNRFSFTKYLGIVYTLLKILWDFRRKNSGYIHTAKHNKRLPQGVSFLPAFLFLFPFSVSKFHSPEQFSSVFLLLLQSILLGSFYSSTYSFFTSSFAGFVNHKFLCLWLIFKISYHSGKIILLKA